VPPPGKTRHTTQHWQTDRLAALDANPELPPTITTTAAEQCLSNVLEQIESTFDDFWHREVMDSWEQRYNYVQKTRTKLDEYKPRHEEGTLKVEEEWEYGQLLHDIEGEDSALPVYRKVYELEPTHSAASFLAGQAMLNKVVGVVLDPPVGSRQMEVDLANRMRFPQNAAFLVLAGDNKPMLNILQEVPNSKLF